MLSELVTAWHRRLSGPPGFEIYGKTRRETVWRVIAVYPTHRRDRTSRLPLWRGTCITWTAGVIAVGRDFAATLLQEETAHPTSGAQAIEVGGGRIHDAARRAAAGRRPWPVIRR